MSTRVVRIRGLLGDRSTLKGLRISADVALGVVASGIPVDEIVTRDPHLSKGDTHATYDVTQRPT